MFRSWCRNKLTPLSQCQQLQSVIIESANQNRDNPASHWYRNLFGNAYIAPDSFKQPDRAFVSAACKMQKQIGSEPKGKVSENPHKKKKSGSGPKQWWPLLENPKIPHQKSQFFCPHKTFFLHWEQYLRKLPKTFFYCDSPNFEMRVCVFAHLFTSQIANSTVS